MEQDPKKLKELSLIEKVNSDKISMLPKVINTFNAISLEILMTSFIGLRNRKNNYAIHLEIDGMKISKTTLESKNKPGGIIAPDIFQDIFQNCYNQNSMVLE